jgi:hypothetical protein
MGSRGKWSKNSRLVRVLSWRRSRNKVAASSTSSDWPSGVDGDIFSSLDADGNGSVTKMELVAWLANNGVLVSDAAIDAVVAEIDTSRDGTLIVAEVATCLREMQPYPPTAAPTHFMPLEADLVSCAANVPLDLTRCG